MVDRKNWVDSKNGNRGFATWGEIDIVFLGRYAYQHCCGGGEGPKYIQRTLPQVVSPFCHSYSPFEYRVFTLRLPGYCPIKFVICLIKYSNDGCSPPSFPPEIYFPFALEWWFLCSVVNAHGCLSFRDGLTPSSRRHVHINCITGWNLGQV